MKVEPIDWSAVVVGYWNTAILTPAGIAQRLFGLESGTPIGVEVPIDGLAPYKVKHENIIVMVDRRSLTVFAGTPQYDPLEKAMGIAAKAIKSLPETPVSASGFNIRYKIEEPLDALLTKSAAKLDDLISDFSCKITSRSLLRTLEYKNGVINFSLQEDINQFIRVSFNFHLETTDREALYQWLCTPINDARKFVEDFSEKVLSIKLEEVEQ